MRQSCTVHGSGTALRAARDPDIYLGQDRPALKMAPHVDGNIGHTTDYKINTLA